MLAYHAHMEPDTDLDITLCVHFITHMDLDMTPCLHVCHFKFIIPY